MTDGNCKRIGRVRLRFGIQRQQRSHHVGDLRLAGAAAADDGLFHGTGRVFVNRQIRANRRRDGDAARMAQLQRRLRIAGEKHFFDGELARRMGTDQFRNAAIDYRQASGKIAMSSIDAAAGDVAQLSVAYVDDAVAREARARVDSQNATGCRGGGRFNSLAAAGCFKARLRCWFALQELPCSAPVHAVTASGNSALE